jgi:CheY-like chemotaxis protein
LTPGGKTPINSVNTRLLSREGCTGVSLSGPKEGSLAVRVLVVDDDQVIRTLVADHLRRGGYDVDEAEDGVAALDSIRQTEPDVVVTDLGMPRLDGLGLLRELSKSNPDLPAIVLTAHESVGDMVRAIREGILFDYQIKPPGPYEPGHARRTRSPRCVSLR